MLPHRFHTLGLLMLTAFPAAAQSTVSLEFTGTARTVAAGGLGVFGSAVVGDPITISFDVAVPGMQGATDTIDYSVLPSSVQVTVGGASDVGEPGSSTELSVKFDGTNDTAFGGTLELDGGLSVAVIGFDFVPILTFTSNDLTQQFGDYEISDFDLVFVSLQSGSTSLIEIDFENLAIEGGGGGEIGTPYCSAANNSTGAPGALAASGSLDATRNDVVLNASALPAFAFGFVIVSETQGFAQNPGGSAGDLCLAGSIGRFVGPGEIQQSTAGGTFALEVDLTSIPGPLGPFPVSAGDTLNFQAWFRDSDGMGGPTSNFTQGLSIAFQ